jgi:hypothetical protein
MKVQCSSASCRYSFEASNGDSVEQIRCPQCGAGVRTAVAAGPPPLPSDPKPAPPPLPAAAPPVSKPIQGVVRSGEVPPYLAIPTITDPNLAEIPAVEQFQSLQPGEQLVKSYQIRVRRPKFSLVATLALIIPGMIAIAFSFLAAGHDRDSETTFWWIGILLFLLVAVAIGAFFLFRMRGHTFLYLTNRRVIVLELSEGVFAREQSVCHFSLEDICGFQLFAQRGLKKLFGLLLLKEKRTFYLGITTRTCCNVQIGAVNIRKSEFDPGRDAVALCGELDAKVLALNAAHAA